MKIPEDIFLLDDPMTWLLLGENLHRHVTDVNLLSQRYCRKEQSFSDLS